jgi:hypothetical protein
VHLVHRTSTWASSPTTAGRSRNSKNCHLSIRKPALVVRADVALGKTQTRSASSPQSSPPLCEQLPSRSTEVYVDHGLRAIEFISNCVYLLKRQANLHSRSEIFSRTLGLCQHDIKKSIWHEVSNCSTPSSVCVHSLKTCTACQKIGRSTYPGSLCHLCIVCFNTERGKENNQEAR